VLRFTPHVSRVGRWALCVLRFTPYASRLTFHVSRVGRYGVHGVIEDSRLDDGPISNLSWRSGTAEKARLSGVTGAGGTGGAGGAAARMAYAGSRRMANGTTRCRSNGMTGLPGKHNRRPPIVGGGGHYARDLPGRHQKTRTTRRLMQYIEWLIKL
jgi:hypothetical protein